MKKVILSVGVVVVFAVYAVYQKMSVSAALYVNSAGTQTLVTDIVPTPIPVGMYKDGSYTGSAVNFFYGIMQVKATISGSKLSDVTFLKYPNDRPTSIEINTQAMPVLKSEAIKIQGSNVDIVSGATDSVQAFQESLASALAMAKN